MNDGEALLAAVLANPEEDLPRLVYADWLDDNGKADRAKFIRASIEFDRLPGRWGGNICEEVEKGQISCANIGSWTGYFCRGCALRAEVEKYHPPIQQLFRDNQPVGVIKGNEEIPLILQSSGPFHYLRFAYERGFIHTLSGTLSSLLAIGPRYAKTDPLQRVHLQGDDHDNWEMIQDPLMRIYRVVERNSGFEYTFSEVQLHRQRISPDNINNFIMDVCSNAVLRTIRESSL